MTTSLTTSSTTSSTSSTTTSTTTTTTERLYASVDALAECPPSPTRSAPGPPAVLQHNEHAGPVNLPKDTVFQPLDFDADVDRLNNLDTACMNCGEEGTTRMLLTSIPYFRQIVLMSFSCPYCQFTSNEVQPCTELAEKATRITLHVPGASQPDATRADLNRQVIRSETCRLEIPEIEFEMPKNPSGRGEINTVEGVLTNIADSLQVDQPNRALAMPEVYEKLAALIQRLRDMAAGTEPFTFVLDDLAGNSFVENPIAPATDPRSTMTYYPRTHAHLVELGFAADDDEESSAGANATSSSSSSSSGSADDLIQSTKAMSLSSSSAAAADSSSSSSGSSSSGGGGLPANPMSIDKSVAAKVDTFFNVSDRSAVLPGQCPSCHNSCETRMCVTDIPHFKDVVLMVTDCEACGFRDSEVKPVGKVSEKAVRITLKVTSVDDMKRDLLKSDTAGVSIPELDLELAPGTLGGKYTTLEGILSDIKANLQSVNQFLLGDSSQPEQKSVFLTFLERLDGLSTVAEPWTFVLDDPLGNIFVYAEPHELRPESGKVVIERYTRTHEQNEELGLNDINVDDYMSAEDRALLEQEMAKERASAASAAEAGAEAGAEAASLLLLDEHERERREREHERQRLIELKQGKIGGMIKPEDYESLQEQEQQQQQQTEQQQQ